MERIAEKHKSLIVGLSRLYDTFVAMHYISASHVLRPPHSTQTIATNDLQKLGFEPEVIDLIQLIPALRSDIVWGFQSQGTEIAPRSKVVNYFADHDFPDLFDDLRWGDRYKDDENTKLLPPWMLRLTFSGQYGVNMIYDTRDQSIIEWDHMGEKMWNEIPSRTTESVFTEMVEKLQSLDWVPYFDPNERRGGPPSREIVENPLIFQNIWPGGIRVPMDSTLAIEKVKQELGQESANGMRRDINRWRALQKLYRDCGWGTESFDGEAFEIKRTEWAKAAKEMQKQRGRFLFAPAPETHEQEALQQELRQEFNQRWETFWTESAGQHAV